VKWLLILNVQSIRKVGSSEMVQTLLVSHSCRSKRENLKGYGNIEFSIHSMHNEKLNTSRDEIITVLVIVSLIFR
jgi:hypothetical protein